MCIDILFYTRGIFCFFYLILTTGDDMKVRLGYVAIPLTLNITCSKTITYTNFCKLSVKERQEKLDELIRINLENLKQILNYNDKNHIHFYRLTSKLLPLVTHPQVSFSYYYPYRSVYQEIGHFIKETQIRVDMHPDQFAVLNSERREVIEETRQILKSHHRLLSMMGINDGKLILHVGSCQGGKEESIKRFIREFRRIPKEIQKRIVLENDDKMFTVLDVLSLCKTLGIPMVLDYHHFLCNNKGEKIENYLTAIFATWNGTGLVPKVHFSTPKNRTKKDMRSHSEYIDGMAFAHFITLLKQADQDVDIMIEAKGKDRALFDLVRQLKYFTTYHFIDDTTFIV